MGVYREKHSDGPQYKAQAGTTQCSIEQTQAAIIQRPIEKTQIPSAVNSGQLKSTGRHHPVFNWTNTGRLHSMFNWKNTDTSIRCSTERDFRGNTGRERPEQGHGGCVLLRQGSQSKLDSQPFVPQNSIYRLTTTPRRKYIIVPGSQFTGVS